KPQYASGTSAIRPQPAIRARGETSRSSSSPVARVLADSASMNPPISAAATRPRTASGTMRCRSVEPLVQRMLPPAFATARANAEKVLDLRAGRPRLLHHLHRLPIGAVRISGGQPRDQGGGDEKAGRVGRERQVPPDHGEGDAAEGGADGQRRGPEGVLQGGRKWIVGL